MNKKNTTFIDTVHSEQSGVALLLSLAFLTLLTVVALSFLSSSLLTEKEANNNLSQSKTANLVDSAINKLEAQLCLAINRCIGYYSEDTVFENSRIYSTYSADADGAVTTPALLSASVPDTKLYDSSSSGVQENVVAPSEAQWVYVTASDIDDSQDTKPNRKKILGRYAYYALPIHAKIDLFSSNYEQTSRYGYTLDDIDMSIIPLSAVASGFWTNIVDADVNIGYDDIGLFYSKMKAFLPAGNLDNYNILDKYTTGMRALNNYSVDSAYYDNINGNMEAYYYFDTAKSAADAKRNYYHRFDLSRQNDSALNLSATPWNNLTVADLLGISSSGDTDDAAKIAESKFSLKKGIDPKIIQYLRIIGHKSLDEITFNNMIDYRKQVAANIIDFFDSNSIPTSDVAPGSWSKDIVPKYTGNEKTSYISEVNAKVSLDWSATLLGSDDLEIRVDVNIDLSGEILDMYRSSDYDYVMNVFYNFKVPDAASGNWTASRGNLAVNVADINATNLMVRDDLTFNLSSFNANKYGVSTPGEKTIVSYTKHVNPTLPVNLESISFAVENFTLDKIILQKSTVGNVDYANVNKTVEFGSIPTGAPADFDPTLAIRVTPTVDDLFGGSKLYSAMGEIFVATYDPRQNLNERDWVWCKGSTLGVNDANLIPKSPLSANVDVEDYTALDKLSTSYIHDGNSVDTITLPMLGLIHRGVKWQTINLKRSGTDSTKYKIDAVLSEDGISYEEGDAGILDQIKLTPKIMTTGLIDLRPATENGTAENNIIWQALLKNITRTDYALAQTGAVKDVLIGHVDLAQLISDELKSKVNAKSGLLKTRSELSNFTAVDNGVINDYDAAHEALVGKFITLTKVGELPDEVQFVIIAQAFEDMGPLNMGEAVPADWKKAEIKNENPTYYRELPLVRMLLTARLQPLNQNVNIISSDLPAPDAAKSESSSDDVRYNAINAPRYYKIVQVEYIK